MRKLKLRDSTLEAVTCSSPPDRKWQDLQPHLPDSRTQAHVLPPPAVKSETSHGQLNFSPSAWLPGSFLGFCSSAQLLLVCVSASLYNDLTWIKLSLKKKKKNPTPDCDSGTQNLDSLICLRTGVLHATQWTISKANSKTLCIYSYIFYWFRASSLQNIYHCIIIANSYWALTLRQITVFIDILI